jgi:hypothetical protein
MKNTHLFEQARSANLGVSLAQQEASAAQSKARLAEDSARAATARAGAGSANDRNIISALRRQVEAEQGKTLQAVLEAQELRRVMTEWRHSHEVYRRLAKHRGIQLGLSEEERVLMADETAIDIGETDPQFAETDVFKNAKARLQGSKPAD